MKTIQLLQSAAAISIVVGKDNAPNNHRPSNNNNQHQHQHHLRRHLQFQNVTCAANETPCHLETDDVVACAKEGEDCPCYFNERRCSDEHFGDYCDTVCCEWGVQERCHEPSIDNPGFADVFCANIADGGCPCPEGETKCGTSESSIGYCMAVCCDGELQQTCFDENYNPSYCAEEGECRRSQSQSECSEGKIRCGGDDDWAGYCTNVCCEFDEETCYNDQGKNSCNKISLGGCSPNTSHDFWKSRLASTILAKGTASQVSYYSAMKSRKKELLASLDMHMIRNLEAEEAALFHAIRIRERGSSDRGGEIPPSIS
mmetsp:Transcript_21050/g.45636  ORF Transcript_21050/g.45636 Transcript_21050/m.45636 type:complete len:315 (-) Transcript_21050:83-1027(-)